MAYIIPLEAEKVDLFRVTPEDHLAPWDFPAADISAMEGFTFAHSTLYANSLKITGFLAAGEVYDIPAPTGESIRIMTGAVPTGCDTVVTIEEAEEKGNRIRLPLSVREGSHVRKRGGGHADLLR